MTRAEQQSNPSENIFSERTVITPEALLHDNHSQEADRLRDIWETNRAKGALWAVAACGDARVLIPKPENTVSVRSIATAGFKEKGIFGSPGIQFAVVLIHFDGETIETGKRPKGCGGLGAKESLSANGKTVRGIYYYIENKINHPDPLIQALMSANEITKTTGKPSLACAEDHRTGRIYPFAALFGHEIRSKVNIIDLFQKYDPNEIYADGIPQLEEDAVPTVFREFIEAGKQQLKDLLLKYPNLREMQRVQNPQMMVISTDIRSMRIRYPRVSSIPGSLFKLHMPRERVQSGITIKPEILQEELAQAQYPIEHAVANFNSPDQSFSKTNRVLIETSDINASRDLAGRLSNEEWMQKWLTLPDHRIIVVQTQEGITNIAEYFAV